MSLIVKIHFQRILHTKAWLTWVEPGSTAYCSVPTENAILGMSQQFVFEHYLSIKWKRVRKKMKCTTGKKIWEKKTGKLNFIIKFILIPCRQHPEMWPTHLMDRDEDFSSVIHSGTSITHAHAYYWWSWRLVRRSLVLWLCGVFSWRKVCEKVAVACFGFIW